MNFRKNPDDQVIRCPAAVTLPTPGKNGCTDVYATLSELFAVLPGANQPNQAGTAWLGKHSVDTAGFAHVFEGVNLTLMAQHALTIKGG